MESFKIFQTAIKKAPSKVWYKTPCFRLLKPQTFEFTLIVKSCLRYVTDTCELILTCNDEEPLEQPCNHCNN